MTVLREGRLSVDPDRCVVRVDGNDGRPWFSLRLLNAVHTMSGPDETLDTDFAPVRDAAGGLSFRVRASSTVWEERWTELRVDDGCLVISGGVRGRGVISSVELLAGRCPPEGFLPSGSALRSVVSPNPDHPRRVVRAAEEPATISVTGSGSQPGVGRWLFTPAPWCFAVSRAEGVDPALPAPGGWASIGLHVPLGDADFTAFSYRTEPQAFWLALDYEGHTVVDGEFRLPDVVIEFGFSDPFSAVGGYCARLRRAGLAPPLPAAGPDWWREPIFCGWGAQSALAQAHGADDPGYTGSAPTECTQANYDEFLQLLAAHDISPGTVVVDDKWARHYARPEPDESKWPDLAGWIAGQHRLGRRILLWWKAWDVDGLPPDACIRTLDGRAVAMDPHSPGGREVLVATVRQLLGPQGLDADGLKVDFTAGTPSGAALHHHGPGWGARLLHDLLALMYDTAKSVKPDALVITHCPNPAFADVTDMVRLNDIAWLDAYDPSVDVVPQMTYRAKVVAAALPGVLIDTDGWCMPDLAQWRAYVSMQGDLGVPALYYAGRQDRTGETWCDDDFALVAARWRAYRSRFDPGR